LRGAPVLQNASRHPHGAPQCQDHDEKKLKSLHPVQDTRKRKIQRKRKKHEKYLFLFLLGGRYFCCCLRKENPHPSFSFWRVLHEEVISGGYKLSLVKTILLSYPEKGLIDVISALPFPCIVWEASRLTSGEVLGILKDGKKNIVFFLPPMKN